MIVSIGADHGGFELKEILKKHLEKNGHEVIDRGTNSLDSVDYPDYAKSVSVDIINETAQRGVLICGTGIGISIAANKFKDIRAALVHCEDYARLARAHNDANIIVFGGRFIDSETAKLSLDIFLETEFEGGRHLRRVSKLYDLQ